MKIAIFHELHKGGARKSVNEIARQLKKKHTVDLYTVDEKKDETEKAFFNSVRFFRFIPKKWTGGNWQVRLYKDTVELYKLFLLHKRISKEINKKKYDIIFIHPSQFTQAPFILGFLKGIKVYYCHEPLRIVYDPFYKTINAGTFKLVYEKIIRSLRKVIDKINVSKATYILTNSSFTKKNILKAYGRNSIVCYHGVDTNFFKPSSRKRDIDVLFIGTKDSTEGGDVFQKIKKQISGKYNLVMLDGTKEWISENALRNYYQRSKIVLCLSRNEPFGMIPLEAGACECVVIAIDEGGYRESIVDNFSGFLVDPNVTNIIKKINYLLSNSKEMNKLSRNARKLMVNEWSWEKTEKKLEEILLKFVGNK